MVRWIGGCRVWAVIFSGRCSGNGRINVQRRKSSVRVAPITINTSDLFPATGRIRIDIAPREAHWSALYLTPIWAKLQEGQLTGGLVNAERLVGVAASAVCVGVSIVERSARVIEKQTTRSSGVVGVVLGRIDGRSLAQRAVSCDREGVDIRPVSAEKPFPIQRRVRNVGRRGAHERKLAISACSACVDESVARGSWAGDVDVSHWRNAGLGVRGLRKSRCRECAD